jgi:hypothetical protein
MQGFSALTPFHLPLKKNTSKTRDPLGRHTHTHPSSLFNIATLPDNKPYGTLM